MNQLEAPETRLRNGDESALSEVFAQHRERLWRMINFRLDSRLTGRVDADDILQDAWLNAVQRIEHYFADPSVSIFIWLRTIALQTMADVHRRHRGTQKRSVDRERSLAGDHWPQATSVCIAEQLLGAFTSPSRAAMRAELIDQIESLLNEMDELDQEILALRHFEELTNTEVAEVLNIPHKTASSRYVRALKRFRVLLETIPGI